MNTKSAVIAYINGEKIRRTVWDKGHYVQLTEEGKQMTLPGADEEYFTILSPAEVLDKCNAETNEFKVWEIYE